MLTEVTFEAFRAFNRVTIPLKRLTVFVGPNGSGKTSVLLGIHALLRCISEAPSDVFHTELAPEKLRNRRRGFKIHGAFGPDPQRALHIVDGKGFFGPISEQMPRFSAPASHAVPFTRDHAGVRLLRLERRALIAPSYAYGFRVAVADDGGDLASVLNDLAGRAPEKKERILQALQRVVPTIRRIRTERAVIERGDAQLWGHRVVLDTASGDNIPLDACSEGTVLALGIMTVLHGEDAPRTLLIDEIDRSLHPKAQLDLVAVLRAAQADDPNLQILATGHSPFLLNALDYDEVRVTTLDDDGFALCASLADHPDLAEWKDSLKPGDWWSSELEDWVKEQAKR